MSFSVQIITPERRWEPVEVVHVTLPAVDGEVGLRTGHLPFVCSLGEGKLLLRTPEGENLMYLRGGVAQIRHDQLEVYAEAVEEYTGAGAEWFDRDSTPERSPSGRWPVAGDRQE